MAIEVDTSLGVDIEVSSFELPRSEYPQGWPTTMIEDYSNRGGESASIADRANKAANGALQAQNFAKGNEDLIIALTKRVERNERNINALSNAVALLTTRVSDIENFNQNPYATLYRTASSVIVVPSATNTDATFDANIPGRKVVLTSSRITLDEGGVYELNATLDFSASSSFTVEVIAGGTTYFTFTGTVIQATTPTINIPLTAGGEVYVNISQTTGTDLSVAQNINYLSVSRQGAE